MQCWTCELRYAWTIASQLLPDMLIICLRAGGEQQSATGI